MKRLFLLVAAVCVMCLVGCGRGPMPTDEKMLEICRHIPNPERLEDSRSYLTADFYEALETMINLPDSADVLHEWELWFVTADGSPMCEGQTSVVCKERADRTHVSVTVAIAPADTAYAAEEHQLIVTQEGLQWRLSDLDNYKSAAHARLTH